MSWFNTKPCSSNFIVFVSSSNFIVFVALQLCLQRHSAGLIIALQSEKEYKPAYNSSISSINFISRWTQYTYHNISHMHNISKRISQMYSSGGWQRSCEADNRHLTTIQLGGIFHCSKMCRAHYIFKMSGSISMSLIFIYNLTIQHGAHKYDIMKIAKHAYKML